MMLDTTDRRNIETAQADLPLMPEPYTGTGAEPGLGERKAVGRKRALIAGLPGPCRLHSGILNSTRIFKNTGRRLKRKRV